MEFYKYVFIISAIVIISVLSYLMITMNFTKERFVSQDAQDTKRTLSIRPRYTVISKQEFSDIVMRSDYFQRMTEADIHARNAKSPQHYMYTYINAYDEFTLQERDILSRCVSVVDQKLKKYHHINNIKWKFVKVMDIVENGYPHTLEDVIVLSSSFFTKFDNDMMKTLLHEKIHVYQRTYPEYTKKLLQMWGFSSCEVPAEVKRRVRNNPDIEDIYCYKQYALMQLYTTNQPSSLADSMSRTFDIVTGDIAQNDIFPDYIHQSEHPYEVMASMIPIIVFETTINSDDKRKKNMFYSLTKAWMLAYL